MSPFIIWESEESALDANEILGATQVGNFLVSTKRYFQPIYKDSVSIHSDRVEDFHKGFQLQKISYCNHTLETFIGSIKSNIIADSN